MHFSLVGIVARICVTFNYPNHRPGITHAIVQLQATCSVFFFSLPAAVLFSGSNDALPLVFARSGRILHVSSYLRLDREKERGEEGRRLTVSALLY